MKTWSLEHLQDHALLHALTALVTQDRAVTAALLAHIVEVEARGLYLHAACSSMFDYCRRVLHMSESSTYKRIHAARAARRFPAIFEAVAEGRLHLSAVVTLAPYLDAANAGALLTAATHKTRAEVEKLIAARFPRADVPTLVRTIAPSGVMAAVASEAAASAAESAKSRLDAKRLGLSDGKVVPPGLAETSHRMGQLPPGAVVPSDMHDSRLSMGPLAVSLGTLPASPPEPSTGSPTAPHAGAHVTPRLPPRATRQTQATFAQPLRDPGHRGSGDVRTAR
jgi:hypothetical protein